MNTITNTTDFNPRAVPGDNNPPEPTETVTVGGAAPGPIAVDSDAYAEALASLDAMPEPKLFAAEDVENWLAGDDDLTKLRARAEELVGMVKRAPAAIADDETLAKFGDAYRQLKACRDELDRLRLAKGAPYREAPKAIDAVIRPAIDALETDMGAIKRRSDAYLTAKAKAEREAAEALRKKEADERRAAAEAAAKLAADNLGVEPVPLTPEPTPAPPPQARVAPVHSASGTTVGARKNWVGEITDRDELDLEKLRPYIALDALQKALNAAVKAGVRTIKGALIEERITSNIRG
jgi:hypothetical protein